MNYLPPKKMSTWTFGCCNYRVNKFLGCFRMYRFIADLRCKQLEKGRHHFRVFSFIEKEKDFNWWKEAANRSFLSSNKGTYQVAYSKTECGCYFPSSSHTFRPFKKSRFYFGLKSHSLTRGRVSRRATNQKRRYIPSWQVKTSQKRRFFLIKPD